MRRNPFEMTQAIWQRPKMHLIASITALLLGILIAQFAIPALAQGGIRAVVVNEFANIRISPAIGASVIDTVSAGYEFTTITARSGDNQWIRVIYAGNEGWVNLVPLVILEGSIEGLPVADPRSIPYGGFEAPRAGTSDQPGPVSALATDGLRVRSGPSVAYPQITNINFNQGFTITGRTASGTWYQVNHEGIVGWVSSNFVQVLSGNIFDTPIDGIVVSSPPPSGTETDDFLAIIRLMLDRINIAQESLNAIRASWSDSALTGRAQCSAYPARPSDIPIATPLLAANFQVLEPLQADFNQAMANLRYAIDLFIEVCNQPGTGNPVGTATVQGALDTVNLTESQFSNLRGRLEGLLPNLEVGDGQCLLRFNGRAQVLPVVNLGTIYLDSFDSRKTNTGYCFDGNQDSSIKIEIVSLPDGNNTTFVSVSALDTPDSFIVTGRAGVGQTITVGPATLPRNARYLVLFADLGGVRDEALQGEFAFRISDVTVADSGSIVYDSETGAVVFQQSIQTEQVDGVAGATTDSGTGTTPVTCPFDVFTISNLQCSQLFTCSEAQACLAQVEGSGNAIELSLDPDDDQVPCEANLCSGGG